MKQKLLSLVLAFVMVLSLLPASALAAEEAADDTTEVSKWSDIAGKLSEGIPGDYKFTLSTEIEATSTVTIKAGQNVTITGSEGAKIIRGTDCKKEIFHLDAPTKGLEVTIENPPTLTMSNLTIDGGNKENSGSVIAVYSEMPDGQSYNGWVYGNVTLSNVKLLNNTANSSGGAIYAGSDPWKYGNIPYCFSGTITLTDCEISNCKSADKGGAICVFAPDEENASKRSLALSNVTITSCEAVQGGAICIESCPLTISGGSFSENKSTQTGNALGGGAIALSNSSITATNAEFKNNITEANGGGIAMLANVTGQRVSAVLTNCTFTGNIAGNYGGALYLGNNYDITINGGSYAENKSNTGGVSLINASANLTVSGEVQITDNKNAAGNLNVDVFFLSNSNIEGGYKIKLDGLVDSSKIGFYVNNPPATGDLQITYGDKITEEQMQEIFTLNRCNNRTMAMILKDDGHVLLTDAYKVNVKDGSETPLTAPNAAKGMDYEYEIPAAEDGNVYLVDSVKFGKSDELEDVDYSIAGNTLTVKGEAITSESAEATLEIAFRKALVSTKVTLNPGEGATFAEDVGTFGVNRSAEQGSPVPDLPTPSRRGYTFAGWFLSDEPNEDDEQITSGGQLPKECEDDPTVTLYAKWTPLKYTVTFPDGTSQDYDCGTEIKLSEHEKFTKPSSDTKEENGTIYKFLGWECSYDKQVYNDTKDTFTVPAAAVTFTEKWIEIGTVNVNVKIPEKYLSGEYTITVKLMNGEEPVGSPEELSAEKTSASFAELPYGKYNVVVEVKENTTSEKNTILTVTEAADLYSGTKTVPVTIPDKSLSTTVRGNAAVNGLDGAISSQEYNEIGTEKNEGDTTTTVTDVTLTLNADSKDENDAGATSIKAALEAAEPSVPGEASSKTLVDYVDITITKTTNTEVNGEPQASKTENVAETSNLITVSFPISAKMWEGLSDIRDGDGNTLEKAALVEHIFVYRRHAELDNEGNEIPDTVDIGPMAKVSSGRGPGYGRECFYISEVEGNYYITIKANKFSVYAFGVSEDEVETSDSAATTPVYTVAVPATQHGTVTVSPKSSTVGTTITVTVTPDEGYALDTLRVIQIGTGTVVEVTENADGTYTFKMPAGGVTVMATFKPAIACDRGENCPMYPYTDADRQAWYHDGVHYCIENGLMIGTDAATFAPAKDTSRAMLVTMLYRLEDEPAVTKNISFSDVPAGQWYSDAVNWAAANGIV